MSWFNEHFFRGWGTDYYTLTVLEPGQVTTTTSDVNQPCAFVGEQRCHPNTTRDRAGCCQKNTEAPEGREVA